MAIVRSLVRPRNIEIRTSQDLDRLLRQGTPVWAGVDISPDTAVQVSTVYACARLIAEDIGKLPFPVYQLGPSDERQRARTSPYWRLIHDRPNPWQTSQQFREYLTLCALLRGDGFAWKNSVGGQVRELLPLHPTQVEVEQLDDFEVVYHVQFRRGQRRTVTRREIFHLMGPSLNGYSGASIVALARQAIGLAMATERHGATLFGNGAHPGGLFRHPARLSDKAYERLKAELDESFRRENAHHTMILEEGMEWTQVGMSNEDSQFLETRKFQVSEIARWFRVPPHKVGDLERATFSNIEHQAIEYVTDTLMPWAKRWENEFNQNVIGTNAVFAELSFDALLRGDTESRYRAIQTAVGGPWMRRNEARRLENLPIIDGLDEVLEPENMRLAGEQRAGGTSNANADA